MKKKSKTYRKPSLDIIGKIELILNNGTINGIVKIIARLIDIWNLLHLSKH